MSDWLEEVSKRYGGNMSSSGLFPPRPRCKSDEELVRDYERTGFLGEQVGTIKTIYPVTEWKCFLKFVPRSFYGSVLPAILLIGGVVWIWLHHGAGPGMVAALFSLFGHALVRTMFEIDLEDWFCIQTDFEKSAGSVHVAQLWPFKKVLLLERVIVADASGKTTHIDRKVPERAKYKPVKVGDKVSRYDNELLFPSEAADRAKRLGGRVAYENKQAEERNAAARAKELDRLEKERQKQAFQRAENEKRQRLAACRLDDWIAEPMEPLVRHLPPAWRPLKTVGLAYANVVAYGSAPPGQRYNIEQRRWETVGLQTSSYRGIYLIGTSSQRTLNQEAIVANFSTLPGTSNGDLVMFVLDAAGVVRYLGNPARWEIHESGDNDDEVEEKLSRLRPVLTALFDREVQRGPGSGGWA